MSAETALGQVLTTAEVVICAGSGGVGKTTTSAAMGLAAARAGRRVVVITIDPARRLADALGLGPEGLGDTPRLIDGPWSGELWAAMLDTGATFDALVARHAPDEQAERILANPFYRNLAHALSGTREYMAAEKLYELTDDDRFDLVVVDTPPTRNAFAFIEAPDTLTRFLDHRLYRLMMAPTRRMARAAGIATNAFLRTVSKVVGSEVVSDAVAFFQSFEGMEEGFRARAHDVAARFRHANTAFVVVTSPRRDALEEAAWFSQRLGEEGIAVRSVVVNRVSPRFVDGPLDRYRDLALDHPGTDLAVLCQGLVDQAERADTERAQLDRLLGSHPGSATAVGSRRAPDGPAVPVVLVPIQDRDVRDLAGLNLIAEALTSPQP